MWSYASLSDLNVRTHVLSLHEKISDCEATFSPMTPHSFCRGPNGCLTTKLAISCGWICRFLFLRSLPSPVLQTFHTRIPLSSNLKLYSKLMSGILLASWRCLGGAISTIATQHPLSPPCDSRALFVSSAVVTSVFSFTNRLMWAFIGAIFGSQMSFPACGSEKS